MISRYVKDNLTVYGGVKCSQDYNAALERGEEMQLHGKRYLLGLLLEGEKGNEKWIEEEEKNEDNWTVDGELFFRLGEKGRWANTALDKKDNNCLFAIGPDDGDKIKVEQIHPIDRFITIQLQRSVLAGDWIHVYYGERYPKEFLEVPSPLRKKPASRLESCVECNIRALFNCKCHTKSYCSQRCANKDHSFN
jgi:hypothetical protein